MRSLVVRALLGMVNASFRLNISRWLVAGVMACHPLVMMPAAIASPLITPAVAPETVASETVDQEQDAIARNPRPRRSQRRPYSPSTPFPRQARRRPRPPRRLPPNRVQPGGGLDAAIQSCDPTSAPLTALVPVDNPVFTAVAHPTFLFYLPDDPAFVDYAEFILLTSDEKEAIYTVQFEPTQAGIMSVSIPAEAAYALEQAQAYHWYLNVYCEGTQAAVTGTISARTVPAVNGWVQRLPEEMSADDVNGDGLPTAWYDAIAQLAAAKSQSASADQSEQWERWLSAIGFVDIVDVPVVGPISPLERSR